MKVLESPFAKNVEATYCIEIGDFHFFSNYVVAEFRQGTNVAFKDFEEIFDLCDEIFGDQPYGFISNRVHSFSVDLVDALENSSKVSHIKAYAVVTYNHNTKRMLAIEEHYFSFKRKRFNTLADATEWVLGQLQFVPKPNKFHPL
ncbi:hypothetical protein [Mangrovimonas sp. TPBH4]|uniref:hypothetical protein n=1 Tax=Mangrovimonas sp. TPBH4 TaxID=1645914 RepID=UPI0006B58441|nr:hypothetical protein [Mangrovimonas sp. TPBH4]